MLGQMGQEGDHVMLGHRFDFVNARDVELHVLGFPHRVSILARDHAEIGHGFAGMRLDLVPNLEFGLGRPDCDHLRAGIAGDHGRRHLYVIAQQMPGLLDQQRQDSKAGRGS